MCFVNVKSHVVYECGVIENTMLNAVKPQHCLQFLYFFKTRTSVCFVNVKPHVVCGSGNHDVVCECDSGNHDVVCDFFLETMALFQQKPH